MTRLVDTHPAETLGPFIVGIGATATPNSSTEQALVLALAAARRAGGRTRMFGCAELTALPHYLTPASRGCALGLELVDEVRAADGLIVASPGYHGSVSGLVKNAIDYLEETSKDRRPYLDGVPVGLIVTAYGWQAMGSTLATLRSIAHALRGWPTPLGVTINTAGGVFKDGSCADAGALAQLETVGRQVCDFARLRLLGAGLADGLGAPQASSRSSIAMAG
jgi:FMN reductase